MARILASVEEAKEFEKGSFKDESLDLLLELLLRAVTVRFGNYCKRQWDQAIYTEFFTIRTTTQRWVWLANPPIAASPALQLFEDKARVFPASSQLAAADYVIYVNVGKVELDTLTFQTGLQSVKAVYTGGYLTADATGAPDDLKLLAIMQACFLYQRRAELGLVGRALEGGSVSLESQIQLLPEVKAGLRAYQRLSLSLR